MCLACRRAAGPLCRACRLQLTPIAPTTQGGAEVRSAFRHGGAAAALVHRVKYEGSQPAARLLARAMLPALWNATHVLVPIPRTAARQWRYGVDGGTSLAEQLGWWTGLEVKAVLRAPVWHRPSAGRRRSQRRAQRFSLSEPPPAGAVLVDDVYTTGLTVASALEAMPGAIGVVTATRAGGTSLFVNLHQ